MCVGGGGGGVVWGGRAGGGGESAPFKCDSSFQQLISCILTVSLIFRQPVPL